MKREQLSVDDAVHQFMQALSAQIGSDPTSTNLAPISPAEMEAWRFEAATELLRLACPDPMRCAEQACRRARQCWHLAQLKSQAATPAPSSSRRTPGAIALRRAIWIYWNLGNRL